MEQKIVNSKQEVEAFLRRFFPKMEIYDILFVGREKNDKALEALGITSIIRKETIKTIDVKDYVETWINAIPYGEMWVFGKDFDDTELYIKISMGRPNSKTICISFHAA